MLEKTGEVVLTEDDIKQYNCGVVSDRIKQTWGFSLEELNKLIEANQFITITKEIK